LELHPNISVDHIDHTPGSNSIQLAGGRDENSIRKNTKLPIPTETSTAVTTTKSKLDMSILFGKSIAIKKESQSTKKESATSVCPVWYNKICDWKCQKSGKKYKCICPVGYNKYFMGRCIDENECNKEKLCKGDRFCFNTYGSWKCLDFKCPRGYRTLGDGLCEKNCRINHKYGYCRRKYLQYHSKALKRNTKPMISILTLRAQTWIIKDVSRVQFYIKNGNSNFKTLMNVCKSFRAKKNRNVSTHTEVFYANLMNAMSAILETWKIKSVKTWMNVS
jgi:hypothetical protein